MFKDLFSHINTLYRQAKHGDRLLNPMAIDKPHVSGYVPPTVYDKLMAFKATRGLQSDSMAVAAILEEYFALGQRALPPSATDPTISRLETLEAK